MKSFLIENNTILCYIANTMVTDDLGMEAAKPSVAIVLM